MPQRAINSDVLEAALDRLRRYYADGHRLIVSFSAGKDSGVALELAIMAATETGRLPVEVAMRDEEIMFPGTFEYAERVAQRPEVDFHWIIANQPIINAFNREMPYFWVFDPLLPPDEWVRQPPYGRIPRDPYVIDELDIQGFVNPRRFPPEPGKMQIAVVGIRVAESQNRRLAIHSSKGALTLPNLHGSRLLRPIYDWSDADIWKAIHEFGWDYNRAYNTLYRLGAKPYQLRIAPPTMNGAGIATLRMAAQAWPAWFERVCERCPGVRTAAQYGRRAIEPQRRLGESWQEAYQRLCIDDAPAWIAERATEARAKRLRVHAGHAATPLPDAVNCPQCKFTGSWRTMTKALYAGDAFASKTSELLDHVEPDYFRPGSGTWGGGKSGTLALKGARPA